MKTKTIPLAFALLLPLLVAGFSSCNKEDGEPGPKQIQLTPEQKELIRDNGHFAFELLKEVVEDAGEEGNVFISPLSVSLALGMTLNGAGGETLEAMRRTLHHQNLSQDQINASYKQLMKDLLSVDPKVALQIANSIWYRAGYPVLPSFIEANRSFFDAEVRELDFGAPGAVDEINAWVYEKTNQLIDKILEAIPRDAVMYLINAIYFHGQWKYSFDPAETKPADFFLPGETIQVPTMAQGAQLRYCQSDHFAAAELPYGQGNYSMVVLLPNPGVTPGEVVGGLDADAWEDLVSGLVEVKLEVRLPKFSFAFEQELRDVLSRMGMEVAFDPAQADFSRINPERDLFISRVIHKAFVDVDEKGTEAAAVTAVEMSRTSFDPNAPVFFAVNRPFLFFIREQTTGAVLFAGRVNDPRAE